MMIHLMSSILLLFYSIAPISIARSASAAAFLMSCMLGPVLVISLSVLIMLYAQMRSTSIMKAR